MKNVAEMAGVSVHTASDILNCGDTRYRESTVKRVQTAAHKLGYRANRAAQSLRKRQTSTIGIVAFSSTHELAAMRLHFAIQEVGKRGYFPLVCNPVWYDQGCKQIAHILADAKVAGLLLLDPSSIMQEEYSLLEQAVTEKVPIVSVGGDHLPGLMRFLSDKESAFRQLTEHLLSHGHDEISVILPSNAPADISAECWHTRSALRGYMAAMKDSGRASKADVILVDWSEIKPQGSNLTDPYKGGYIGMRRILSRRNLPDAVIASNDSWARGAQRALGEVDLRVPQDIALVGSEGELSSLYGDIGLTTFRQPLNEIAACAVGHLMAQIRSENVSRDGIQLLKGELIIRDSCGCRVRRKIT